jgi:hypothetical protein
MTPGQGLCTSEMCTASFLLPGLIFFGSMQVSWTSLCRNWWHRCGNKKRSGPHLCVGNVVQCRCVSHYVTCPGVMQRPLKKSPVSILWHEDVYAGQLVQCNFLICAYPPTLGNPSISYHLSHISTHYYITLAEKRKNWQGKFADSICGMPYNTIYGCTIPCTMLLRFEIEIYSYSLWWTCHCISAVIVQPYTVYIMAYSPIPEHNEQCIRFSIRQWGT